MAFKDRKIVLSTGVRLAQPLACPPVEIPQCDLLLLDAEAAEPNPPAPRRVAEQIKRWIVGVISRGMNPVICVGSKTAALDMAHVLRSLSVEVRVHRSLFEMFRRIEEAGFAVLPCRRLGQNWLRGEAVLYTSSQWPQSRFAREDRLEIAYVGPGRQKPDWAQAAFRLGEGEDRSGLVSYVKQIGVQKVALGPRCDEETGNRLRKLGVEVYRVHSPEQIALPLW